MRRRQFITLIGGGAATWPLAARAQQPAMPMIGILHAGGSQLRPDQSTGIHRGLSEQGFIEHRNVAIELRGTEQYDQLPAFAAELVQRQVAVIFALGTANSVQAAKAATATIPIVFANGSDPVTIGVVASVSRPGGNVTGLPVAAYEPAAVREYRRA